MKQMLVIGLGRFGRHVAMKFAELGNEVMVVDTSEEKIDAIAPLVTSAQIGDCTKQTVLDSLGVRNFDICVVAISSNFEASLEITMQLKDLGAPFVIAKAGRDIHAKFLSRNGADEVIYPERMSAERLAKRLNARNVFDYIELSEDYSILEVPIRENWEGKTIAEVGVRSKFGLNILAVKRDGKMQPIVTADHLFSAEEHLLVFGRVTDLNRFTGKR